MGKKKKDLEKDELEDLELEDELEDEDSEDVEEDLSEDEQEEDVEDDEESDEDDEELEVVPAKVYKGLQRTVAKKDKELADLKEANKALAEEMDGLKDQLSSGDKIRIDLQKRFKETSDRIAALETENEQSKTDAMQNRVIAAEFPGLARLKEFIPSASTEDEYRENCKALAGALGEEVTKTLDHELNSSTPPVEDDDVKPVSQAQIDKYYAAAMKLAGVEGKEEEYESALGKYMKALQTQKE